MRHADAVYAVMLKKPAIAQSADGEESAATVIDHLQWETIRERVIRAGTVLKLVESLIDADGQMDSRQFNVFFATYRAFSNAAEVFRLVTDLYTKNGWAAGDDAEEIRRSLRAVLMCWLEMYPEDFYEQQQHKHHHQQQQQQSNNTAKNNSSNAGASSSQAPLRFPTLEALIDFAHALHDLKQKGKRVRERLRRVAHNGGLGAQLPSIGRYSFAIIGNDPNEPTTTTTMLTLWNALFFRELRPYQCQGAIWGRRHKTGNGPVYSVRATIDQFNAVSERVMTSIVLSECQADQRARIVEKWVEVARELRALKIFSALKATISALQSEPVFRLKQCWAQVSKGVRGGGGKFM